MALWGATDCYKDSSDEYAVSLADDIHPVFKTYRDSILIVSGEQKSVSSRAGHALMEGNPYAPARYAKANDNIKTLLAALKSGDLDTFINITESEALQLHALMMCSNPSYILMKPNTLNLINEIREFRQETKIPLCFTLDAGPNVHLLYPENEAEKVEYYIKNVLADYCDRDRWIADHVGEGPKKLQ
jgi:diphosphomevalonate decarboxylase